MVKKMWKPYPVKRSVPTAEEILSALNNKPKSRSKSKSSRSSSTQPPARRYTARRTPQPESTADSSSSRKKKPKKKPKQGSRTKRPASSSSSPSPPRRPTARRTSSAKSTADSDPPSATNKRHTARRTSSAKSTADSDPPSATNKRHTARRTCQPKSTAAPEVRPPPPPPPPQVGACGCGDSFDRNSSNVEELGDPIVKSPLDTHGYKMVRLKENGMRGLLVSTCLHPRDIDKELKAKKSLQGKSSCVFRAISEFNKCHCNLDTNAGSSADTSKSVKFSKASDQQIKMMNKRRLEIEKKKKESRKKARCRQGVHEQNDELESFCNNYCVVVIYVKAGFFQDPKDMQGMAHFCEHVITLGSKNFPESEALSKFVETEGGGIYNALTDYEYTALYFEVQHEQVDHAMEMFADVLANPIFQEKDIPKEIDNINSEFEGKKFNDDLRRFTLHQSCVLEGHPASNFGIGSKDSLTNKGKNKTEEIMKKLKEWMRKYYCSSNMMFAIQGPKSLDELEALVSKHFSKVPKTFGDFPASSCPTKDVGLCAALPPFIWPKWNRLYHMITSANFMTITWALDPKFGRNFQTKPINYFSYILGKHESGSLSWYLREKGWILGTHVNYQDSQYYTTNYHTLFSLYLELTTAGMEKRIDILAAVFSYIKLLKKNKPSQVLFDEARQVQSDLFHYRSDLNLSDPTIGRMFDASSINETMFQLIHTIQKTGNISRVLVDSFIMTKFDPAVLSEFVNSMNVRNAMVVFGSEAFDGKANEVEKWYGTHYYSKPVCQRLAHELENNPIYKEFRFPGANPFISMSSCYGDFDKEDAGKKSGVVIYETPKGKLSYGNVKCQKGLLPSAEYSIDFTASVIEDILDIYNCLSADLLQLMLRHILSIRLGSALSSLISFSVDIWTTGKINITLNGPSPKLPQLGNIILDTVNNFDDHVRKNPQVVRDMMKLLIGQYKTGMEYPEECGLNLLQYVLCVRDNFPSDYIEILDKAFDEKDFLYFVEEFVSSYATVASLDGCVTKSQASIFANHLDSLEVVPYKRLSNYEIVGNAIKLPIGERCLLVQAKNKESRNVIVMNYYQFGVLDKVRWEIMRCIFTHLHVILFEELRTKQSLGYTCETNINYYGGIPGLYIFVQGVADTHSSGYINERIDRFLLEACNDCFYNSIKFKENISSYSSVPIKMNVAHKLFLDYLLPNGENYRKLSVQIQGYKKSPKKQPIQPDLVNAKVKKYRSGKKLEPCGKGADGGSCGISTFSKYLELDMKNVTEENGYFITDIKKFKNAQPCFGNMEHVNFSDEE